MEVESDGVSVQAVGLVGLPGTSSFSGGPAGVDLIDSFASGNEALCEPTTIAPGTLNADSTLVAETHIPALEAVPAALAIGAVPVVGLAPELVERETNVDFLVSIDAHRNHFDLPGLECCRLSG